MGTVVLKGGRVIDGTGEQTRSFTSVHDIVRANLLAADAPLPGVRVISCASGVQVSIGDLAAYVNESTGKSGGIAYAPPRPGVIAHFEVVAVPLQALGIEVDRNWRATVALSLRRTSASAWPFSRRFRRPACRR